MPLVSEGHYALFTTEFARDSLAAFLATIPDSVELSTHKEIFKSVYEIYVNAALFCQHKYQDATYSQALALYHEGKTVLLPSGWAGHFVDVILSKIQQMYVVANSGDRYTGESAQDDFEMEPGDQAGLNFYRLEEVDKLNEKFIRNTLHNDSKMNLELEQPMKFGMLESLFNIENPDQEYGNCGWESHRDAVEGILLIELLNRDVPFEQAKDQAKHMYESWDLFHGNYAIDKYMDNNPGLPVEALMEILLNLQPKKKEQISDSMNLENKDNAQNVSDKHPKIDYSEIKNDIHAKKIIETLQSDTYKEAFKDFINTLDLDDENIQNLMHDLKECYQVDVDALLSDATQIHSTALPVTQGNVTETFSEAAQDSQPTSAHFDIGHQLMVPCFLNAEIV